MTYCETPESAIESSKSLDIVTRWRGNPDELLACAKALGYETDTVAFAEQLGYDEFRDVVDIWGWTEETPEGEQDWRVYVEVA